MKVLSDPLATNQRVAFIQCQRGQGDSILARSLRTNFGLAEFELVSVIDAPSMACGFNAGATAARAPLLAFTHDDVELVCGKKSLDAALAEMEDPSLGVLGVAGSAQLLEHCVWWQSGRISGAILHTRDNKTFVTSYGNFGDVLVLDGVFLLCRRDTFNSVNGFDETIPGFDYYDIDFTLRVTQQNFVNRTFPLMLWHHCTGWRLGDWNQSRCLVQQRHRDYLPCEIEDVYARRQRRATEKELVTT